VTLAYEYGSNSITEAGDVLLAFSAAQVVGAVALCDASGNLVMA